MGKNRKNIRKNIEKNIAELIETIRKIEGQKIITLANFVSDYCHQYDISKDGVIGYEKGHELLFKVKLLNAMYDGGSIVIRQFTDVIVDELPIKNIYGIVLHNGEWTAISAEEIELAHCTDHKTGGRISKEKNVIFSSLI